MDINFPLLLVLAVLITGLIALFDKIVLLFRKKTTIKNYRSIPDYDKKLPKKLEYVYSQNVVAICKSILPILLLVLILRSFLFEPFQIPSGSMLPTLEVGDFILVNKYNYGLRLPIIGTKILSINNPQRGDVMVFKEPSNPNINFIKRVIGVPGDEIRYINKQLIINNQPIPKKHIVELRDEEGPYKIFEETIDDKSYKIRQDLMLQSLRTTSTWLIPKGHYFMMGDNRDRSNDSRYWGMVPEKNIIGKAVYIWMHWPSWTKLPNFQNNRMIESN